MAFRQLSLDIWQDVELWLPYDLIYLQEYRNQIEIISRHEGTFGHVPFRWHYVFRMNLESLSDLRVFRTFGVSANDMRPYAYLYSYHSIQDDDMCYIFAICLAIPYLRNGKETYDYVYCVVQVGVSRESFIGTKLIPFIFLDLLPRIEKERSTGYNEIKNR